MGYDLIKGKSPSVKIIYVHGTGSNRKFLRALAEETMEYDSVLLDLAGHGDLRSDEMSFDNYVKSVRDIIKSFDSDSNSKVVLVGHSMGGSVVLKILSENIPNVLGGITICSGASYPCLDKEFMSKVHNGILDMNFLAESAGNLDNLDVQEALATFEKEDIILKDFIIDESIDVHDILSMINVPVLVMYGEEDTVALPIYSSEIFEGVKNSYLQPKKGYKHMLPIADKVEVSAIIEEFIVNIV